MRRLSRLVLLVFFASVLVACQSSLPGKSPAKAGDAVTPNAVTGGEIEVTALDAIPSDAAQTAPVDDLPGNDTAPAQATPPVTEPASDEAEADAEPAPKADLEATPVTPKSDMQIACEKKRGNWSKVGKGNLKACVFQTRDGGKQCSKESQCEGVCLARSGSCSPIKPLFGCNEILQDDGRRVTLCID